METKEKLGLTLDEIADGSSTSYGPCKPPSRRDGPYPQADEARKTERQERYFERKDVFDDNTCRINEDADVNRAAGRVAYGVRIHGTFFVIPASWECIWVSWKVMALARSYLQSDVLDFSFDFIDSDDYGQRLPADLAFEISMDTDGMVQEAETKMSRSEENYVSANSDPKKVAGRLASLVREKGDCCVSVSGWSATGKAIESLQKARNYIMEDGRDLSFSLSFGRSKQLHTIVYISIFKFFRQCRVSGTSDIHSTAGYIAQGIRAERPPAVQGIGIASLNLIVKAVALARKFLEQDNLDIACRVVFPEYACNVDTLKMKLVLATVKGNGVWRMTDKKENLPLYVSGASNAHKVAGALAQRLRNGEQAFLAAMGPAAVCTALKTLYLANRFLHEDSIRVRMSPEFAHTDQGLSTLCIHTLPELWVEGDSQNPFEYQ